MVAVVPATAGPLNARDADVHLDGRPSRSASRDPPPPGPAFRSRSRRRATAPGQPDTDVTSETSFTIAPAGRRSGASCTANSCGASRAGAYTVTGRFAGASGTASLTVTAVTTTAGFLRDARTGRPIKRSCVALRSKATNRTFIIRVDFGRWSLRTYDPGPFHLAFYVIDNKRCAAPEPSDRYLPLVVSEPAVHQRRPQNRGAP